MTDREAMKQALDFIERVNKDGWMLADFESQMYAAITALRERLAEQPAQRILELEALLERQTARIVDLQTHIDNFDGEDR